MRIRFIFLLSLIYLIAQAQIQALYHLPLIELSDIQYPDNPDISLRDKGFKSYNFDQLEIKKNDENTFDLAIISNEHIDTFVLLNLDLSIFIPTIPDLIKGNNYLELLAIINQEWNRQQVNFGPSHFTSNALNSNIIRIDVARNCLQSGLWEIFMFRQGLDGLVPVHHSWFDFPMPLYEELFYTVNGHKMEDFSQHMKKWKTPKSKTIQFAKFRKVIKSKEVEITNHNNSLYPLVGEQKKKYQNIIFPRNTLVMQDFLTDESRFATFSPPGYYNTKDPRVTELGRLYSPEKVSISSIVGQKNDTLSEILVQFIDGDKIRKTKLYISGVSLNTLPHLSIDNVDKAWKSSMGFGNHTFYETIESAQQTPCKDSRYFCVLTDENERWLDSHSVGIDGPVMHWDDQTPNLLHLWILSFERHCFVSHISFIVE